MAVSHYRVLWHEALTDAAHGLTHTRGVPAAAPRYDDRIFDAVRALDDTSVPMAETCRRVAAFAEALGLARPSLVHLRTYVREHRREQEEERERRRFVREFALDMAAGVATGRILNPYDVEEAVRRRLAS